MVRSFYIENGAINVLINNGMGVHCKTFQSTEFHPSEIRREVMLFFAYKTEDFFLPIRSPNSTNLLISAPEKIPEIYHQFNSMEPSDHDLDS